MSLMTYIFRTHTPRDFNILIYVFVVIGHVFFLVSFFFVIVIIFYLDQPDTKPIFRIQSHQHKTGLETVHPAANRPYRKSGPFFLKEQTLFV